MRVKIALDKSHAMFAKKQNGRHEHNVFNKYDMLDLIFVIEYLPKLKLYNLSIYHSEQQGWHHKYANLSNQIISLYKNEFKILGIFKNPLLQ